MRNKLESDFVILGRGFVDNLINVRFIVIGSILLYFFLVVLGEYL